MLTRTFFNRPPLVQTRFALLPAGAVSARGAARDRLLSLRAQLLSRIETLCPAAGEKSVWFGGDLPGGMQTPNLLEAMLLTGALLGDGDMLDQAQRLCRIVAGSQREDGSFGAEGETFAARGRMLRALTHAYAMSADKQYITFMLRYMKYLKDVLSAAPLSREDALHTGDTLAAGIYLYNILGQKAILPVLTMLIAQGSDYTSLYHTFTYRTPVSRTVTPEVLKKALAGEDEDGYYHHLLRTASAKNLCEGLRTSALCGLITGSSKHLSAPEVGLTRMLKSHGTPCGGLTGTPLLAGRNPAAGVSAESICEMAASLEALLTCPDGEHVADHLEALLYNGVDAAFAPDGRGVQRIQQANQIKISREPRFDTEADDANLFTFEDGGVMCALAGAWPRFMMHQWLLSRDGGLCAMGYASCAVRYRLKETGVRLEVDGNYPLGGTVRIRVGVENSAAFPIHLRIPSWAEGANAAVAGDVHNAKAGAFLTINRQWNDGDEILLTLPMTVERIDTFHQSVCIKRGPLCFAHVPEFDAETSEEGYHLLCAKEGFGVALRADAAIEAALGEDGTLTLSTLGVKLPRWKMKDASCAQPPIALDETGEEIAVRLVPYAASAIRLCVLPQA